jgi:glycosyltransferase involved in cell wall biosynthesis
MPGRRVLMIAHHFPPAGGSGSNRALAFARYLPRYDWQPVVVTPGAAWASNRDDNLTSQLAPGLRVIRTHSFEPRQRRAALRLQSDARAPRRGRDPSLRAASFLRSNAGHLKRFPDAHMGWLPFALAAAKRQDYDVAYSSSGPFTSHLVGLLLKRMTGRPWVAELRDGWYCWNRAIFPDYPAWRDALERRLEAATLRTADAVVLVTDRMADAFRHQYPDLPADHFAVVSNGFDPCQFERLPPHSRSIRTFEVVHSGALYYGRSLRAFLDAAQLLCETDSAFAEAFKLSLLGTLDAAAQTELRRHALGNRVCFRGQVDHAASLAAMRSADVLLLIANTTPGAEATVPGKLFEYLAVGRPVLAVAPDASSTADVLDRTGGGWLAPAGDSAAIACALQAAFKEHQVVTAWAHNPGRIARFDRRVLAGDLATIFERVSTGAARRI